MASSPVHEVAINHIEISSSLTSTHIQSFADYESVSSVVNRRIRALKKLQFEKLKIDGHFYEEVFDLHIKYAEKYAPILEKRCHIINGKHEPNDDECDFTLDEDQDFVVDVNQKLKLNDEKGDQFSSEGIPGFWFLAMLDNNDISEWIGRSDEPVLMHLKDIKVFQSNNPSKLRLEFIFSPNDFFTNEVLTKEYDLRFGPDPQNPWKLEEYVVVNCKGCPIDWKEGKNVRKESSKVENLKEREDSSEIDSFFEFFDPPVIPEKYEDIDDKTRDLLADDWILGKAFVESVVPNAVLHLTGDIFEDEDSSGSESSYDSTESLSPSNSASYESPTSRVSKSNPN